MPFNLLRKKGKEPAASSQALPPRDKRMSKNGTVHPDPFRFSHPNPLGCHPVQKPVDSVYHLPDPNSSFLPTINDSRGSLGLSLGSEFEDQRYVEERNGIIIGHRNANSPNRQKAVFGTRDDFINNFSSLKMEEPSHFLALITEKSSVRAVPNSVFFPSVRISSMSGVC